MKTVINNQKEGTIKQTKTAMAKKMGISRGMLYYQHKRPITDEEVKIQIMTVMETHKSYGHKRIALELKLNKKRILRIMKENHLKPKNRRSKKPVKLDDMGKKPAIFENRIKSFCPLKPNIVWVGDFTYIRFNNTFIYVSTVMDIYTREIIGWHISATHTKDLVIKALLDALQKTHTTPIYFHSDQGSEYVSGEYTALLEKNHIIISMSKKSAPWENGYQESFYSGFKLDLGETYHFHDPGELVEHIAHTIYYYNNERIHTVLKTAPKKFRLGREYLFNEMGT
jgi:putative transposase